MADLTTTTNSTGESNGTGPRESVFTRLYTGTGAFNFVGRRKQFYIALAIIGLVCVGSMVFKGFNYGIDFVGGTTLQFSSSSPNGPIGVEQARDTFEEAIAGKDPTVQAVGTGENQSLVIKSAELTQAEVLKAKEAIATGLQPTTGGQPAEISDSAVSGSWGGEITQQALIALVVFLILVSLFLGFYFERWMAVAALASLICDLVVTAGVYSLVGFEVTPGTVIGMLTILGFSLYDTVVVFGRVKENTRGLLGLTRRTYGEATNLALNQTLMRSINTSLIAILPVLALLVVGVGLLGVGTLKDLALVQLVGMFVGAFSSLVLAGPLLVDLKMTDPAYRQQEARVFARRNGLARKAANRGDFDPTDDESLEAELRHERALAAASAVPARHASESDRRRPTGKAHHRPSGRRRR